MHPPWTPAELEQLRPTSYSPEAKEKRRSTIASREEALIELSDRMRFTPFDAVAVMAADKLLDRLEGKPMQKTEMGARVTLEMLVRRSMGLPAPVAPVIEAEPETPKTDDAS